MAQPKTEFEEFLARSAAEKKGVAVQPYAAPVPVQTPVNLQTPGVQPQVNLQPPQIQQQPLDVSTDSEIEFKEAQERSLQEKEAAKAQVAPEVSVIDQIKEFFTGEKRTPESIKDLPTPLGVGGLLQTDPEEATFERLVRNFKLATGMLFESSTEGKEQIIKNLIPEAKFETNQDGARIIKVKGKKDVVLDKPGLTFDDTQSMVANVAAYMPSAKLAQIGKGVLQRSILGGVTAAQTEGARQDISQALGSEQPFDPTKMVVSGALGAAAETVVPAVQAVKQVRRAKALGVAKEEFKDVAPLARKAERITKETGIGLFKGQQTMDPSQLRLQSILPTLSAGSRKASARLKIQNKEASIAVNKFISSIAPDEALLKGKERFRTVAKQAVEAKKNIRKEATSKLYNEAYKQGIDVDTAPIKFKISQIKDELVEGSASHNEISRIEKLVNNASVKDNLRKLQSVKFDIDGSLGKSTLSDKALDKETAGRVLEVKKSLLETMDNASPLYREAREKFTELTPDVLKIQESVLGKIAKLDDVQVEKQITNKIFDPDFEGTQMIKDAKAVMDEIDPKAWNYLLRVEARKRLRGMELGEGEAALTTANIPGQYLRALIGTKGKRAAIYSSVDGEMKKSLRWLERGLERSAAGRALGSPTATYQETIKPLRGGVGLSIRDLFKNTRSELASIGEDAAFNRNVRIATEASFNPKYRVEMSKLRELDPNSPAAARALTQLFNRIDKTMDKKEQ